jgi:hypothetical protein
MPFDIVFVVGILAVNALGVGALLCVLSLGPDDAQHQDVGSHY